MKVLETNVFGEWRQKIQLRDVGTYLFLKSRRVTFVMIWRCRHEGGSEDSRIHPSSSYIIHQFHRPAESAYILPRSGKALLQYLAELLAGESLMLLVAC